MKKKIKILVFVNKKQVAYKNDMIKLANWQSLLYCHLVFYV